MPDICGVSSAHGQVGLRTGREVPSSIHYGQYFVDLAFWGFSRVRMRSEGLDEILERFVPYWAKRFDSSP